MEGPWFGDNGPKLGALAIRHLETLLFNGHRPILGNDIEFFVVFARGVNQPNTIQTGVAPTAQLGWRASPILI